MKYDIEFEAEDLIQQLNLTKKQMNKIARKMMARVLQQVRKDLRKEISGKTLNKRTGNLYRKITLKANNDFSGFIKLGSYYATFLEKGVLIKAKKKKYLTFRTDSGNWVRKKEVRVPARPFIEPTSDKYFKERGLSEPIMEQTLQQELDKLFKE